MPAHRIIAAEPYRVPPPFRAFAVRSEEPQHAWHARAPYGRVHSVRTGLLDDAAVRARLCAQGHPQVAVQGFSDIAHADTSLAELTDLVAQATPGTRVNDPPAWGAGLAAALHATGVLGSDLAACQRALAGPIHYLGSCGAGFHNDVGRHWSRCLFWLLALEVDDVEFVMPHAGVRLALAPGDLLVFDPCLAHGLCRPHDQCQAVAASFEGQALQRQLFLTGELMLDDVRWAALGAPWLPVEAHAERGALDLMLAEFDQRSGTLQRPSALRDSMLRSTCHVEGLGPAD